MNRKKRLGICMPPRAENNYLLDVGKSSLGALYPDLLDPIMEILRNQSEVEIIEDLNFRDAIIIDGKVYCGDVCLNELDRYFWYCEINNTPGSFDLEALKTLSRETEVITDPYAYEICQDKYRAHLCLKDAGVRVPECVLFDYRFPRQIDDILNEWGCAILKPRRGGWGKGVTFIDTPESLRDIMGYVLSTAQHSPDHGFFLERYYPNDPTRWASTTMINDKLTLGYRKVAEKFYDMGNGRLKVQDIEEKGGGAVLADLHPEHYVQAELASKALGAKIIGFDMIWTEQGPMIVDENNYPGNYAELYEQMGTKPAIDFAELILQGLKSTAPSFVS